MTRTFLLLPILIISHVWLAPYAEDDAYIHFRVAHNLWNNGVATFNISDGIQGSTSLVWTGVLTWLAFAGLLSPSYVAALNGLFIWGSMLVWRSVATQSRGNAVSHPILSAALLGAILPGSIMLMETPLALLLFGGGALALLRRNESALALLAGASWTRPEAALAAIPLLWWLRNWPGSKLMRAILFGGIVAATGLGVQYLSFGTVVPHTIAVKSTVYELSTSEFFKSFVLAGFGESLVQWLLPIYVVLLVSVAIFFIVTFDSKKFEGISALLPRLPLACGSALIFGSYWISGTPVFEWYAPFVTVLLIASVALPNRSAFTSIVVKSLLLSPFVAVLFLVAGGTLNIALHPWAASGARVRRYLEISSAISKYCPHARIAAPEIGGLGWNFHGEIIDGIGLATKNALEYHPMTVPAQRSAGYLGAFPAALAARTNPDIIVGPPILLEEVLRSPLMKDFRIVSCPAFLAEDAKRIGESLWGSPEQKVIIRNGGVCSGVGREICGGE